MREGNTVEESMVEVPGDDSEEYREGRVRHGEWREERRKEKKRREGKEDAETDNEEGQPPSVRCESRVE